MLLQRYRALIASVLASAALACAALSGCDRRPASIKTPHMTELSPRLKSLFEKPKTVCFGRFLVDVPANATVAYGQASVPFRTLRLENEADRFDEWVAAEEEKLKQDERGPLGSGLNHYVKTIEGARPGHKIVVGYSHVSDGFYKIVSFVKSGADTYVQESQAMVDRQPSDTEGEWVLENVVNKINDTVRILRARAEDEVPEEPGACIDGAFVPDAPVLTGEWVPLGIRLAEFPDVHLSISMAARGDYIGRDEDLDVRLAEGKEKAKALGKGAWYAQIKRLRQGPRLIGEWEGKEALSRMPSANGKPEYHRFVFIGLGKPNDKLNPKMDVQLDTGVKGNSAAAQGASLTDEEAVALWDKVTGSIRVRPVNAAAPKKTSDASPIAPTGPLRAATGEHCPATGEWECTDHGQVQRRHIRVGQAMPQGVFAAPQNTWQKLRGEAPTYASNVVWTLLSPDAPPQPGS
ncbi:MAG: T6SS immunity protein Tli4 family protein [Pseudomonadota bacterium]|nr:T6SS immunity protein Tli4 family protein [Pseudomonadota bacterium]